MWYDVEKSINLHHKQEIKSLFGYECRIQIRESFEPTFKSDCPVARHVSLIAIYSRDYEVEDKHIMTLTFHVKVPDWVAQKASLEAMSTTLHGMNRDKEKK